MCYETNAYCVRQHSYSHCVCFSWTGISRWRSMTSWGSCGCTSLFLSVTSSAIWASTLSSSSSSCPSISSPRHCRCVYRKKYSTVKCNVVIISHTTVLASTVCKPISVQEYLQILIKHVILSYLHLDPLHLLWPWKNKDVIFSLWLVFFKNSFKTMQWGL